MWQFILTVLAQVIVLALAIFGIVMTIKSKIHKALKVLIIILIVVVLAVALYFLVQLATVLWVILNLAK